MTILEQLLLVLAAGLVAGSFISLASYRLPLSEDIVVKPSRCPRCETRLGFRDLWPILSWLASRGKCNYCKTPISLRYPLTELATVIIFLLIYARYGLSLQGGLLALLAVALLIMIVADLEHYMIPDQVHFALAPLAVAYRLALGLALPEMFEGFMLAGGVACALHYGYRFIRKKEGLGFGDVKFMAVAGLWLGLKPLLPFLFFAGLLGVISGLIWRLLGRGHIFPFGPSLALSLFACVAIPEASNFFWNIAETWTLYN